MKNFEEIIETAQDVLDLLVVISTKLPPHELHRLQPTAYALIEIDKNLNILRQELYPRRPKQNVRNPS